jgi:hypothetical protein
MKNTKEEGMREVKTSKMPAPMNVEESMDGFLAPKETLTRKRVEEIFREKQYSFFEQKVTLLEIRDDSLLLKISFLLQYKNRMIAIEEKEPIVLSLSDFKIEDWGDGVRKIADIG